MTTQGFERDTDVPAGLNAFVNGLLDPVMVTDSRGGVVALNAAAEHLLGCSSAASKGRPMDELAPWHVLSAKPQDLRANSLNGWRDSFTIVNAEGRRVFIEASVSRAGRGDDAGFIIILREAADASHAMDQALRLNGLYAARGHIHRAVASAKRRHDFMALVCRALVDHGGVSMAWVGWWVPESNVLAPVASHGDDKAYLSNTKVYVDARAEGQGLAGNAFREGRPMISEDILADRRCAPWQEQARLSGFRACAVFPVRMRDQVCGTLNLYSKEVGFFKDKESALLAETVSDISFALDNFVREEEREGAEAAARRERALFDAMIESTPGILYLYDEKGRFLRWNKRFETVSGYTGEEIAQMHPSDFFLAEHKPALEARIAEVFTIGSSTLEAPFVNKQGRAIPYFLTGQRIWFEGMACLVGVGIDISAVKQAQQSLEASERRFRSTLDNIIEACQLLSADWRYLYLNNAAAEQNRRPNAELLGQDMRQAWPGIERTSAFVPIRRCMQERKPFAEEVQFTFPDGAVRWFDLRAQPVPEGVFLLSIDITERHQAEQALRDINSSLEQKVAERTEELRAALVRAEAADRTKSAFLATMSHELRTPLNSIIGFTGILAQGLAGPVNEEQSKQLGMVRASSRHLLELINDVLDISKIEAGELEVELKPFDVAGSVRKIAALMAPAAEAKGLKLEVVCTNAPTQLTSDQRRVEQIVLNLLSNAVKFTACGGVKIVLESPPQDLKSVCVQIADTGVGIKAEDFDALFQPFRQIQDGIARPYEGTGLGLAICRRLADHLGAKIEVASAWGHGSTFTLVLPKASGDWL